MSKQRLPLSLLRYHQETFKGLGKIVLRSLKLTQSQQVIDDWRQIPVISRVIPAPNDVLVNHYIAWSGAAESHYQQSIPPHLVSQWGLALATDLLLQTKYNLASVINQGVTLKINGDLPRHQDLLVQAKVYSVHEQYGLARVSVQIITGTSVQPNLVETILHMAFLLADFKKSKKVRQADHLQWQQLGQWQATAHDGLKFALLTGDFNPIHWIGIVGKLSAFKQKVLHGFGMLVRTYEFLPVPIHTLDVRFLKPVSLPSAQLNVEVAELENGKHALRLIGTNGVIHLSGQFQ
ncbi:MAG: protein dehydratase [Acinetobacter populi]|jgi:acyl dehydratase|uniref:MaoC/PaaZ C-terminal domain-containing protein n=1 Tax=Acinetobacter populi TaxID=1582270 RepID=UPI002352AF80|nr:MaoC/PaaZ C-terminal domain-containing protein [Acinetobacter populi]MCH4247643.1 protein dehydratase [Acinetobacter populi]